MGYHIPLGHQCERRMKHQELKIVQELDLNPSQLGKGKTTLKLNFSTNLSSFLLFGFLFRFFLSVKGPLLTQSEF